MKTLALTKYLILLTLSISVNAEYDEVKDRENTLVMVLSSIPTSIDPHDKAITPNASLAQHIYNTLFYYKPNNLLAEGLAKNYKLLDKLTWRINLKKNILFHDGSQFNADDVIYTFDRIVKKYPSLDSNNYSRNISSYEKIDDYSIKITTNHQEPDLIDDLTNIFILNKEKDFKKPYEMDQTQITNGTGPFKLKRKSNNEFILERNNNYYGKKSVWQYVKIIANDNNKETVENLINGKVDIIEKLNPENIKNLRTKKNYNFIHSSGERLIFLYLDSSRNHSPNIKGPFGEKIINPLKKSRVRKAISMAINRKEICNDILYGAGDPTLQYVEKSLSEYNHSIPSGHFNVEKAKKLLSEAGYPNGFQLTLHGPNDRYINDEKVLYSIAPMLESIGIKTSIKTLTKTEYFKNAYEINYSAGLIGWTTATGKLLHIIEPLMTTYDYSQKKGIHNFGRYSDKDVDKYISIATQSFDTNQVEKYSKFATDILLNDHAIIPLYFEKSLWAMSNHIKLVPEISVNEFFANNFQKIK